MRAADEVGAVTRREIAWAFSLSLILLAGILGTLFLQTAMQTQARTLQTQKDRSAALSTLNGQARRNLAHAANPAALAQQARQLHMRPQTTPAFRTKIKHRHRHASRFGGAPGRR